MSTCVFLSLFTLLLLRCVLRFWLVVGVSVGGGDGGVIVAGHDTYAHSGPAAKSVWDGAGAAVRVVGHYVQTLGFLLHNLDTCKKSRVHVQCWILL